MGQCSTQSDDEEVAEPHKDEEMGLDDSEIPTRGVVQHVDMKMTK
jgi:hypothetical protein